MQENDPKESTGNIPSIDLPNRDLKEMEIVKDTDDWYGSDARQKLETWRIWRQRVGYG